MTNVVEAQSSVIVKLRSMHFVMSTEEHYISHKAERFAAKEPSPTSRSLHCQGVQILITVSAQTTLQAHSQRNLAQR
jgi:hypothetical protein